MVIGLLLIAAAFVGFGWTVPAYLSKDFEWDRVRINSTSGFVTHGSMFVTFRTDGPLAANNPIYAASAAIYLTTDGILDGDVQVEIHWMDGASGDIRFRFPSLRSQGTFFYSSFVAILRDAGSIVPASSGPVGIRAWIMLKVDEVDERAWSQYTNSTNNSPATWIDVGPASELFSWLGLKAAAAGLLVAAASQVFQAVESGAEMLRKRVGHKDLGDPEDVEKPGADSSLSSQSKG